jgi:type I restriction enzyme S subunit
LPLPAPREQNRIVELLEQADALRQKRAAADTLADRILPALFHKLFGDPATNPKNWPTDRLGNVAQLEWGNTSITKASYTQSGFPAYSASGQDGFVANFEHEGDGIVVSAIGARCGKCFFASDKWTAIKNTLTITSPDQSKLDLKYLFAIVNDESFWLKRGGGQPFIALGAARDQRVPLPPLALQQSFACKADLQSFVLNRQTQSQGKTEALFATMLHRAFTGELTAQWREAHLKELLAEMEQQAKALNLPANGKN